MSLWLEELGAEVTGLSLPPEAGTGGAFESLQPNSDHRWVDIRGSDRVRAVFRDVRPQVLFHLAAQALVGRGYEDCPGTFATNVLGTVNVLEAAAATSSVECAVVVTTDKVYAPSSGCRPLVEDDPLGGTDPYSASKACAELVARASRGRGYAVATARAGNVVGGGDRGESRLVPDVLAALEANRAIELRRPSAVRPWQFVLEPLSGYLLLARAMLSDRNAAPLAVNFGPDDAQTFSVRDVVEHLHHQWGTHTGRLSPGMTAGRSEPFPEIETLRLSNDLARESLGWTPTFTVGMALDLALRWELARRRGDDLRAVALQQIAEFVDAASFDVSEQPTSQLPNPMPRSDA